MFETALGVFVGGMVLLSVLHWNVPRWDKTDAPGAHSGIAVYTDHETGVQYVTTGFGGLTPRIDANGKPMIAKD
jgi:Family of unknown function (DUF6440)